MKKLSSLGRSVAACSVCGEPAVYYHRARRRSLCIVHFQEHVVSRVDKVLGEAGLKPGDRILLAVSGGKDSATLLDVLSKLSVKHGVEVYALHIYLGLGEYSDKLLRAVKEHASRTGIPLIVVDVRLLLKGDGIPEFARKARRPTCSVCGLVKRYVMNAVAAILGASYIATGHNADDAIAYIMKSFMSQDMLQMRKWLPWTQAAGSAVARIRPLYEVYEKETLLYALVSQLPFVHEECPYRPEASIEDRVKEMMNKLEEEHPGIKLTFLRRFVKNTKPPKESPGKCRLCGMPAATEVCAYCRLTAKVYGEPLGPQTIKTLERIVEEAISGSEQRTSPHGQNTYQPTPKNQ